MAMCYPSTTDWGCALTPEEIAALDPKVRERSEMLAWQSLQRLTGFRLALCQVTVRPCAARCNPGVYMDAPVSGFPAGGPYISGGQWFNACGCGTADGCGCGSVPEVLLPVQEAGGPITVKINGQTLDPWSYRVDNGNRLVRTDGGSWPLCQDMSAPVGGSYEPVVIQGNAGPITLTRTGNLVKVVGEVLDNGQTYAPPGSNPWAPVNYVQFDYIFLYSNGEIAMYTSVSDIGKTITGYYETAAPGTVEYGNTFEVSYYPGLGPDDALNYAAGLLAVEWYKACSGKECRLPSGATRIQRQGINFEVPADMFASGISGIREVDAIVSGYNPYRLTTPSSVFSPDRRGGRIRTA